MKFKNTTGKDVKIRLGTSHHPTWVTAKENEVVELDREIGLKNKFVFVEKTQEEIRAEKEEAKAKAKAEKEAEKAAKKAEAKAKAESEEAEVTEDAEQPQK